MSGLFLRSREGLSPYTFACFGSNRTRGCSQPHSPRHPPRTSTHRITVHCAIRLLLAGNVIEFERQRATNHTPNAIARTESTLCATTSATFRGEVNYASTEPPLGGDIKITIEKPATVATTTTIISTPCTK